jgi:hypothetical protein
METLAWLLTAATLSLFVRFSFAADAIQPQTEKAAQVQTLTPQQLTNKLAKKHCTMLDDSGEVLFA